MTISLVSLRRRLAPTVVMALALMFPAVNSPAQTTAAVALSLKGILHFRVVKEGMYPASFSVKQGRYVIVVTNGVSLAGLSIQLGNTDANLQVASVQAVRGQARQSFVADLVPGKNTLTVTGSSTWKATITVTAQ